MNTLCMLPYAQKYLHGYSNVLLSLGDVIYWLHCQSTSISKRLNFYLSEHNLMDFFAPGKMNMQCKSEPMPESFLTSKMKSGA